MLAVTASSHFADMVNLVPFRDRVRAMLRKVGGTVKRTCPIGFICPGNYSHVSLIVRFVADRDYAGLRHEWMRYAFEPQWPAR